jgi:hypothetical protein
MRTPTRERDGDERTRSAMRPRRWTAALLILAYTSAALSACGGQHVAAGRRVSLLPHTAAKGSAWEWTSACRVGPHSSTACEAAGPNLGVAQLAGNQWNLGGGSAATGSVTMRVNSTGGLEIDGNLSSAPPCTDPSCVAPQANTWVRGYPSVLYGIDQCRAATSPQQSAELPLPMKVASIPRSLTGSTTYGAQTSQVTYDVAYDLWLSNSGTKTPCQTDGTLEVMVWTNYDAQSLLPDSLKVGRASVPFAVNGDVESGKDMWSIYVNNVYGSGHTAPWGGTVWLVLHEARTVKHGTVTVDLSAALAGVGSLLQNRYGWSNFATNYWLNTIAFGMEFGPDSADPYGAGPTDFGLNLKFYCLGVGTTLSSDKC